MANLRIISDSFLAPGGDVDARFTLLVTSWFTRGGERSPISLAIAALGKPSSENCLYPPNALNFVWSTKLNLVTLAFSSSELGSLFTTVQDIQKLAEPSKSSSTLKRLMVTLQKRGSIPNGSTPLLDLTDNFPRLCDPVLRGLSCSTFLLHVSHRSLNCHTLIYLKWRAETALSTLQNLPALEHLEITSCMFTDQTGTISPLQPLSIQLPMLEAMSLSGSIPELVLLHLSCPRLHSPVLNRVSVKLPLSTNEEAGRVLGQFLQRSTADDGITLSIKDAYPPKFLNALFLVGTTITRLKVEQMAYLRCKGQDDAPSVTLPLSLVDVSYLRAVCREGVSGVDRGSGGWNAGRLRRSGNGKAGRKPC